ncbi:metal-dependent hydrolase [Halorussus ruber]|uniref:metal-dependent hydrolase n=1 Tax=Halorussus ruber TaxID=1126238 RepID=UPI001092E67F|nr:metal-dependent hydrolase [Halorussus ruber]
MVDVIGHFGMALIWLAPVWFFIDRPKTGLTFVGAGFWFGMVPDMDLVLKGVFPTVKHHGITHTILFVTVFAAVVGPIVGWILEKTLGDSDWFSDAASRASLKVGFIAVWVAGLAHVFADMLSAPDIAEAVEPFWPLYGQSLGIDIVWYNNPWFNWGLFVGGIVINAGLWYWSRDSGEAQSHTSTA